MNKRRIIVGNEESLLEIFEKVSACGDTVVTIQTEYCRALANHLSFRILLFRFPDKKFQIITNDKRLRRIAESLGTKAYAKNDDIEFEADYGEKNLLKHNFSFFEYLAYEMRKFFSYLFFRIKKHRGTYRNAKVVKDSNAALLFVGLVVSVTLLAFIFYFAVSRTYVYITPELSVRTASRNVVFTEKQENTILDTKNVVLVRYVEFEASTDYVFNVSTYDTGSVRSAQGKIDFYNELSQAQDFRPNTRLVTEDGLVYRTTEWIKIPATKTLSGQTLVGHVEARVVADVYDAKGDLIGVRGNIGEGVVLSVPGLKFNRDKIYAKTKEPIAGGQDPTVKILTTEEFAKFQSVLAEKVKMKALEGLKQKISDSNIQSAGNYAILPIEGSLKYFDPVITAGSGVNIGSRRSDIQLFGTAKISALTYDRSAAIRYLSSILRDNLLYGTEKLHNVNEDSFRITNVLFRSDKPPFSMKATAELDSTISYNFEDPTNNLTKKLKNLIVNSTEKEATSILLNDANVAGVKFRFSPFWLTRVSSNPDSVEFVIEK